MGAAQKLQRSPERLSRTPETLAEQFPGSTLLDGGDQHGQHKNKRNVGEHLAVLEALS